MSQGEGGGRPRKFPSIGKLNGEIRAYFDSCFELQWFDEPARDPKTGVKKKDKKGRVLMVPVRKKIQIKPFGITDLAVWLGTNRQTLIEYASGTYDTDKERFSDAIKNAKAIIEASLEGKLSENIRHTGTIFNLKNNFGWRDRVEIDHTTKDKEMTGMTPEDRKALDELNQRLAKQYESERKKLL